MKWLFLIHQVKTKTSRERVKVWRLTKKAGAILYRNSVYVLPYTPERLEDFQWLCTQIRDAKGEASVFVSEAASPSEDRQLRELFSSARDAEYATILETAQNLLARARKLTLTGTQAKKIKKEFQRLQQQYLELQQIDFFPRKTSGQRILAAFKQIEREVEERRPPKDASPLGRYSRAEFQGKQWGTRKHIHIDRLCSAWLIARFIDQKATFVFAAENKLSSDVIPFDIFGREFSHHGDDCTFETLMKAFSIDDAILAQIGQIVHDIDLKDGKYGRQEAAGVDLIVRALSNFLADDVRSLELGTTLLDALYHELSRTSKTAHV